MKELTPLPAATVALVRDTSRGLEVLMLLRNYQSGFMPGTHVFPGGALDAADHAVELHALCAGLDDAAASRALGVERGGLAYWIAAVRESFEEAGLLLAYDAGGALVSLDNEAGGGRFRSHRDALNAGEREFSAMLRSEGLRLAADRLLYFSNWITPVGALRRYDTRFFLALAPERQLAAHDNREAIDHAWLRPAEALDRLASGGIKMRTPTVKTLEQFADYSTATALSAALSAALRAQPRPPAILPRLKLDGGRLLPGDPGYEDPAPAGKQGEWKT